MLIYPSSWGWRHKTRIGMFKQGYYPTVCIAPLFLAPGERLEALTAFSNFIWRLSTQMGLCQCTYLDLRKDTNKCPFPRFLPLGRISCEGAGNGHFLIIVVNFGFRAFWADLTLLCVKMCRFFWAEIPGKKAEIPGKRAEIPGQIHHDSKMKAWSGMFFLEMVIFILKWVNLQKMVRNQTKICPGKKFVTNEYPGMQHAHRCVVRFRAVFMASGVWSHSPRLFHYWWKWFEGCTICNVSVAGTYHHDDCGLSAAQFQHVCRPMLWESPLLVPFSLMPRF